VADALGVWRVYGRPNSLYTKPQLDVLLDLM